MNYKEKFIKLATTHIKRKGISELLETLEKTDFFTAPASTRFHNANEGGLVSHSVNVFHNLILQNELLEDNKYSLETLAIVGLFHDLCKIGMYVVDYRNTKDENGKWIKVPYYTVKDQYPYGHGEKSVDLLRDFMTLTVEEKLAIRWHMGGFTDSVKGGCYSYNEACETTPLVILINNADLWSSFITENNLKK
jgi:hypothetical protein